MVRKTFLSVIICLFYLSLSAQKHLRTQEINHHSLYYEQVIFNKDIQLNNTTHIDSRYTGDQVGYAYARHINGYTRIEIGLEYLKLHYNLNFPLNHGGRELYNTLDYINIPFSINSSFILSPRLSFNLKMGAKLQQSILKVDKTSTYNNNNKSTSTIKFKDHYPMINLNFGIGLEYELFRNTVIITSFGKSIHFINSDPNTKIILTSPDEEEPIIHDLLIEHNYWIARVGVLIDLNYHKPKINNFTHKITNKNQRNKIK